MFIMINDGAQPDHTFPASAHRILVQRIILYDIMKNNIAVALLKGTDYADSKVSLRCIDLSWFVGLCALC